MNEVEYRHIPWAAGYRVGNDGSVWSSRIKGSNILQFGAWKQLTTFRRSDGCRYVVVCIRPNPGAKLRHVYLHRLVLQLFVSPCPDGMEACHNDGNTANNCHKNLRWDTRKNNHADKNRHGTMLRGTQLSSAKIDDQIVVEIFRLYAGGLSSPAIGKTVGLTGGVVRQILARQRWSHVIVPEELIPKRLHWSSAKRGYSSSTPIGV